MSQTILLFIVNILMGVAWNIYYANARYQTFFRLHFRHSRIPGLRVSTRLEIMPSRLFQCLAYGFFVGCLSALMLPVDPALWQTPLVITMMITISICVMLLCLRISIDTAKATWTYRRPKITSEAELSEQVLIKDDAYVLGEPRRGKMSLIFEEQIELRSQIKAVEAELDALGDDPPESKLREFTALHCKLETLNELYEYNEDKIDDFEDFFLLD